MTPAERRALRAVARQVWWLCFWSGAFALSALLFVVEILNVLDRQG